MPSPLKTAVNLRGTDEYIKFLDELAVLVGRDDRADVVTVAVADLARRHKLAPPPRTHPGWGGSRKKSEPRG